MATGYRAIPQPGPQFSRINIDAAATPRLPCDQQLSSPFASSPPTPKMLATPSGTPKGAPPSPKITRGHSCVLCQQRKVKCDRQKPCSNCIKARADCVPSAPTIPRRRRRKLSEQDLAGRLRRYEHLLRKNGVKIEEDDDTPEEPLEPPVEHGLTLGPPRYPKSERGMLFSDHQNSRYVENTLWENLRDEIQDPKEALQTSSDDEINETNLYPDAGIFLLGHAAASKDLSSLHPPPVQIFRLWQTFLVNVNPLVKIFHAPTVQQIILDASEHLENVPRATEALMFAIYLIAVTSLRTEECETMFSESRSSLLSKYSHMRYFFWRFRRGYDPHTLWVLTGVGVRISQRLGIHLDGADHNILPFDVEMRRRTWWQIVFLDAQASKLAGAGFPSWLAKFDTKMPLNISDSDLSPGMKEAPVEKEGATEMLFCCLRYEVAQAFRKSGSLRENNHGQWYIKTGPELITQKDQAIDELEVQFREKFIKYCDPSIPLHLLAIYMSQSVICAMRLMAHHPRQYPDKGASMPQKEKDMLFTESLKGLSIAATGQSNKLVQGFQWHIYVHFQLDAFIYILSELRARTIGEEVDRAWEQVEASFDNRPEMLKETKNSLYYAIGNLTLKAWAKREEARGLYEGLHQLTPPRFISVLRSQRNIPAPALPQSAIDWQTTQNSTANKNYMVTFGNNLVSGYNGYGIATDQWKSMDFGYDIAIPDITPNDWEYWQTLMDGDLPTFTGDMGENLGQQQYQ